MIFEHRGFGLSHMYAFYFNQAKPIGGDDGQFMLEIVGGWALPDPMTNPNVGITAEQVMDKGPSNYDMWKVFWYSLN